MKFTIPLIAEIREGKTIPWEKIKAYLPKEKEIEKERRERLTLLSVNVRSKKNGGLLGIVRQCLWILGELPELPLRAVMFNMIPSEDETLIFELTSFAEVGEMSL